MQPASDAPNDGTVHGRAFPPGASLETPATLVREGDDYVLRDVAGEVLRRVPREDLRMDTPLGRLERRVALRDGAIFLTEDGAGLDALLGRRASHVLHGSEGFGPRLILVVLAAILAMVGLWRYGLPALVEVAVWATPAPMLAQLDSGTMATFDRIALAPSDLPPDQATALRDAFAAMEAVLPPPAPGVDRDLVFRASPRLGPNAFALPGGTVVMTDELVELVDGDIDALAGVLAHELIHVEEQHGLRALYRSLSIYVVIALVAGDTGPILDELLLEGNALLSLAGSRSAELEADAGAVRLTAQAGYDPEGLLIFFETIAEEFGEGGGWLSTHPGSDRRADEIRRLIDAL